MRRILILALIGLGVIVPAHSALASIVTTDLAHGVTASDLANSLTGGGLSVSNVTYTGADVAAGTFSGGATPIGFDTGIILSSGDIANVVGPNVEDGITGDNQLPGDTDLTTLAGADTFDASVLAFDFVPTTSTISFHYVFASDEYNEFVNDVFNDVFAFYVNGTNCATVGAPPAIVNAVVDALSHLGVTHIEIPITPPRLWRLMQEKGVAL